MKTKLSQRLSRLHILRSLKVRIFIIILLVGFIPTVLLRATILRTYMNRAVNVRINDIQNQCKVIANHLLTYNYLTDNSSQIINAELGMLSDLYDGRVIIIDQSCNIIKDTYGISEGKTMISEEVMRCLKGEVTSHYDAENLYIEITTPIVDTTLKQDSELYDDEDQQTQVIKGVMLTSVSADNIQTNLELLKSRAMVMQTLAAILLIAIAWVLSQILVRPFDRVTTAISGIKDGFQTEQISVPDYIETEHIVAAFNDLLGRMKVVDESRQEFVSNVSHELKTPITSMKVLADSLLQQEDVPVELYKEFMVDIADEIDRENKIITDLLALVKMDKRASDLNIESILLNELLERLLKRLRPIAKQRNIDVLFESVREVWLEADEVKLSLALSNFIENAIKYNVEYGYVKVICDADHQFALITVEDNGIGIPEEDQEHIFERFYRVDKSHSTEIGGNGLGLAIARSAVLMHRGSVQLESQEGKGTKFFIKIPLIYLRSQEGK
ncbi:MAG: cell wall metabolism sensor histidine kinase WalK [Lachnospiraceae bacterium]|nr:cell wall metabolism sensor histidine kinase WalK [Lachnospiraceae bacterium]